MAGCVAFVYVAGLCSSVGAVLLVVFVLFFCCVYLCFCWCGFFITYYVICCDYSVGVNVLLCLGDVNACCGVWFMFVVLCWCVVVVLLSFTLFLIAGCVAFVCVAVLCSYVGVVLLVVCVLFFVYVYDCFGGMLFVLFGFVVCWCVVFVCMVVFCYCCCFVLYCSMPYTTKFCLQKHAPL